MNFYIEVLYPTTLNVQPASLVLYPTSVNICPTSPIVHQKRQGVQLIQIKNKEDNLSRRLSSLFYWNNKDYQFVSPEVMLTSMRLF